MKYKSEAMRSGRSIYFTFCITVLLSFAFSLEAQTLLERPSPPRLVNDFAGLLSTSEQQSLENKLVAFNDSTSNQIAVVIVNDLQGYDRSDFAYKVAKDWGVGQSDLSNGILVLVKTKTSTSNGQVFIATGTGLEGAVPDIACARIIDREMLPKFREGKYYEGLDAGTDVLMALAAGEYSFDDYKHGGSGAVSVVVFAIVVISIILLIFSNNSDNRNIKRTGSGGLPFWLLLGMMGGGRSHGGSWGGFSGGGFGGGSSGGFGGFGGGGFGGGGAGGSW